MLGSTGDIQERERVVVGNIIHALIEDPQRPVVGFIVVGRRYIVVREKDQGYGRGFLGAFRGGRSQILLTDFTGIDQDI